ncbi:hypothetical protein LCGC14_1929160 [marine sediment metagenome]|uniref:Uncharacterized protein n=1 Tax=marine sediment metagenome TaxID=412755 RepID=A0A0F9I2E3_9ZZZZ
MTKLIDHVLKATVVFVAIGAALWIVISAIIWLIGNDLAFQAWILIFGSIGALIGLINWYVNNE